MINYDVVEVDTSNVPKSGTVVISFPKPKQQRLRVTPYKDKTLRKQIGVDGRNTYLYVGRRTLDLERETDREEYAFLKNHPFVTGAAGKKRLKVVHVEAEADKRNVERQLMQKMLSFVNESSDEKLRDVAVVLGLPNPYKAKPNVLRDIMGDRAVQNPESLETVVNDTNFYLRLVLRTAIHRGLVRENRGVYSLNGKEIMGSNEESALAWLNDNQDVLLALREEIGVNPQVELMAEKIEAVKKPTRRGRPKNKIEAKPEE